MDAKAHEGPHFRTEGKPKTFWRKVDLVALTPRWLERPVWKMKRKNRCTFLKALQMHSKWASSLSRDHGWKLNWEDVLRHVLTVKQNVFPMPAVWNQTRRMAIRTELGPDYVQRLEQTGGLINPSRRGQSLEYGRTYKYTFWDVLLSIKPSGARCALSPKRLSRNQIGKLD